MVYQPVAESLFVPEFIQRAPNGRFLALNLGRVATTFKISVGTIEGQPTSNNDSVHYTPFSACQTPKGYQSLEGNNEEILRREIAALERACGSLNRIWEGKGLPDRVYADDFYVIVNSRAKVIPSIPACFK